MFSSSAVKKEQKKGMFDFTSQVKNFRISKIENIKNICHLVQTFSGLLTMKIAFFI